MEITSYKTSYALYSHSKRFLSQGKPADDETFCAWCDKSVSEIKKTEDLDEHLEKHVKDDESPN